MLTHLHQWVAPGTDGDSDRCHVIWETVASILLWKPPESLCPSIAVLCVSHLCMCIVCVWQRFQHSVMRRVMQQCVACTFFPVLHSQCVSSISAQLCVWIRPGAAVCKAVGHEGGTVTHEPFAHCFCRWRSIALCKMN